MRISDWSLDVCSSDLRSNIFKSIIFSSSLGYETPDQWKSQASFHRAPLLNVATRRAAKAMRPRTGLCATRVRLHGFARRTARAESTMFHEWAPSRSEEHTSELHH